jgi:hypothetical protein
MKGLHDRIFRITIYVLMLALLLMGLCASAYAAKATYTYDVSPDGQVRVTIHPGSVMSLYVPVTAENLTVNGARSYVEKNWNKFRNELILSEVSADAVLTYDWPDGALTFPERISESSLIRDADNKWYTDNFYTEGPAEVTIILPSKAEIIDCRDQKCEYRTETGKDGRVRAIFDVPSGLKTAWMGVSYRYPWVEKYATYGQSPMYVRYPAILGKHPYYMAKVKSFHDACWGFYKTYKNEMSWAPPFDVEVFLISWIQGYGGAYTTGRGIMFNYRSVAGFEYPPVTYDGALMGAYHEMSHIFQPAGYPDFIGGHTWTCYHTMLYDWNDFPTIGEILEKKAHSYTADQDIMNGYPVYEQLYKKGVVPSTWFRWPDELEEKIKAEGCKISMGQLHEKSQAYVMLRLERDYGKSFWGKYARVFIDSGICYDLDEPVRQQIVAAQMSRAAGQDLTEYLSKLSGCDLSVKIEGEGKNLISNGTMDKESGWGLEAWKPGAKMDWDSRVGYGGKGCLRLTCNEPNDVKAMQTVKVQPNTYYLLSAWVKTDVPLGPSGACLSLSGDRGTMHLIGTSDGWKQRALPFYSGDATEMDVQLRLGWSDTPTTGTVWFDDVKLYPLFSKNGWDQFNNLGIAKG